MTLSMVSDRLAFENFSVGLTGRIPDFQRGDPVRVVFLYSPTRFVEAPSFMNTELVSIERR